MTDLRDKVREDQGLLKKIELAIPGFRGYRKREDLRIADSLLRKQLADYIRKIGKNFGECKKILVNNMELDYLDEVGKITNLLDAIEGKIRHAEHGYTGISSDYRISIPELNKLYEWDLSLINHIHNLKNNCDTILRNLQSEINGDIKSNLNDFNNNLRKFEEIFEKRRVAFVDLGVDL
jgi:hypothetical protein